MRLTRGSLSGAAGVLFSLLALYGILTGVMSYQEFILTAILGAIVTK